jgi:hypothetical protein
MLLDQQQGGISMLNLFVKTLEFLAFVEAILLEAE